MKKLLSLLLCALILASCSTKPADTTDTTDTTAPDASVDTTTVAETTTEEVTTEYVYPAPDLKGISGNGETITVLTYSHVQGLDARYPYDSEYSAAEENATVLDQAIHQRNLAVEEKLKVKIATFHPTSGGGGSVRNALKTAVPAGDAAYDIATHWVIQAFQATTAGYTAVMTDLDYIDLAAPWYFTSINDQTSVNKQHFMVTGYANPGAVYGTGAMFFNKELIKTYKLENPYELVNSGKWTLDKVKQLSSGMSRDVNGDGKMDVEDFYGFTTNNSTWLQFFTSAGCYSVEKDANDMPKITFGTEKNVTVLQSIVTYLNDPGTTLLAERITGWPYSAPKGGANLRATIPNESFTEGRSLLTADLVGNLTYFREMKMDFGVVPAPKFDEAQKDYTIYIHQGQASTTQIPLTVAGDRLKLVSAVIEQSMYESYQTIKPVLYDQILGARDIRDAESADCLNIILSSGRLDLGCAYNLAIDSPIRTNVATNDTNIVSVIETNKAKNDTNLQKLIDNLQKQVDLQKAKK